MSSTTGSSAKASRLHALASERDDLLASLEDLEREHAAGDLDDADYEVLRADYVVRAARALRAIEALEADVPTMRLASKVALGRVARVRRFLGRRRTRRVLGTVGVLCAVGIVVIAAARLAGIRLPGEDASGSVNLPRPAEIRQQLEQASILGSTGKVAEAVALYGTVLAEVPDQPEALAYRGWLIRLAGIASHEPRTVRVGDAELAKAARVAPGYAPARGLYGMALLMDDGQLHPAIGQFDAFLADKPPRSLLRMLGTDMAAAYAAAHERLPAALRPYAAASEAGKIKANAALQRG
jgi:hypothetical protein